jgi:hypothetical protein
MQWGESEGYLLELAADGRKVQALNDKPELTYLQSTALDVFWLLSAGRPVGFGPSAIPTIDIFLAANAYGLAFDWLINLVRAMDHEFLIAVHKSHGKK